MQIPGIVIIGGIIGFVLVAVRAYSALVMTRQLKETLAAERRRLNTELQEARRATDQAKDALAAERRRLDTELREARKAADHVQLSYNELARLLAEKSRAMPWIAGMVADLHWSHDEREAQRLETKKHPAHSAAEAVRGHAREKKIIRAEKRLVDYRLALMESLFPWLKEIGFDDAEQLAEMEARQSSDNGDPAANWLSTDEWANLSATERYQRALDRYKKRAKTDWEIGRDYERFVGYHWENQGYDVVYYGAIKGFDDFGRDLIVTGKTGKIAIIQCKFWSKHKTIPEAAIFQLLGSTVSFYIEKTGYAPPDLQTLYQCIQPYLYSSTKVNPRIRDIALAMGIKVKDDVGMKDWPMVKCNIAVKGEKIYHLPMDQQYDRVKISKPGEFYAQSVAEAEENGFRRAKRWVTEAA